MLFQRVRYFIANMDVIFAQAQGESRDIQNSPAPLCSARRSTQSQSRDIETNLAWGFGLHDCSLSAFGFSPNLGPLSLIPVIYALPIRTVFEQKNFCGPKASHARLSQVDADADQLAPRRADDAVQTGDAQGHMLFPLVGFYGEISGPEMASPHRGGCSDAAAPLRPGLVAHP